MKRLTSTILLITLFFILSAKNSEVLGYVLFEDNFDTGDSGKWQVARNTCYPQQWLFQDGKVGMKINKPPSGCVTEIVPNDLYWDSSWNDYVIDVDMEFIGGYDKNLAWRYSNPSDWVDIHFMGSGYVFQRAIQINSDNIQPFANGNTYHFTVIVSGNNYKVYYYNHADPDEISYLEAESTSPKYLTGRPALQASAGSVFYSEVWFDNYVVSSIDNRLGVEHFSQIDPEWKDDEYDFASRINPVGLREIEDWGCALTSAAMVLNYHGFTYSKDGLPTNPQTLNQYLIENHGYNKLGGLNWSAVTKYAREAKENGYVAGDLALLKFKYADYSDSLLADDIHEGNPPIVQIVIDDKNTQNPNDDGLHFVVARGYENGRIDINDPADLEDTEATIGPRYQDKTLRKLARFLPTHTDLSYLWLYEYNPQVNVMVERYGYGQVSGVDEDGNLHNDLDATSWFQEGVFVAPPDFVQRYGANETGYDSLVSQEPESGWYKYTFTSTSEENLEMELIAFGRMADEKRFELTREVSSEKPVVVWVYFDKDNIDKTKLVVIADIGDFIEKVKEVYDQGRFKNWGQAQRLISYALSAERFYPERMDKVNKYLDKILRTLDSQRGKMLQEEGYWELVAELELLRESLEFDVPW